MYSSSSKPYYGKLRQPLSLELGFLRSPKPSSLTRFFQPAGEGIPRLNYNHPSEPGPDPPLDLGTIFLQN